MQKPEARSQKSEWGKKFFGVLSFVFCLLSSVFCLLSPSFASDPTIQPLEEKAVPFFSPPKIKTHTFENGLKVFFLEDHELPLLKIGLMMEVGTVDDPEGKIGMAGLTMATMRTGGAGDLSADEVDEALEKIAAEVSVDTNKEYSMLRMKMMSADVGVGLPLFFSLLKKPLFDPKKLELARDGLLESIKRRNEKPASVAQRKLLMQLYGTQSPWARVTTLASVESITREEVLLFFEKTITPSKIRVAVSGDIPFEVLLQKMEAHMKDWRPQQGLKRHLPPVEKKWVPSIHFVEMPLNQSSMAMGHFAEKRFNPDKYALILANYILGGSTFASRLGNKIRTTMGLAYSVYSSFGMDTDYGVFMVAASTKNESTLEVIEEVRREMRDMIEGKPVTTEEVEVAKRTILGQLIFQYEDPFNIVETEMEYDFYGYPPDYLSLFQREIRKVGRGQVKEALNKYFFPDNLKIVVVGSPGVKEGLSPLGKIELLPAEDF